MRDFVKRLYELILAKKLEFSWTLNLMFSLWHQTSCIGSSVYGICSISTSSKYVNLKSSIREQKTCLKASWIEKSLFSGFQTIGRLLCVKEISKVLWKNIYLRLSFNLQTIKNLFPRSLCPQILVVLFKSCLNFDWKL